MHDARSPSARVAKQLEAYKASLERGLAMREVGKAHGVTHQAVSHTLTKYMNKTERPLLGSGVVGPGPENRAASVWCASESGSS
jgi:hypothetical protein